MSSIIKVTNLSKQYRLGQVGTGTISHDLNRWWHRIRGKEDPFLKIGEENDRTKKSNNDYAWALRDINFEVRQGEILGIIGRNGAGKSTLLKILSRTTAPTTGQIKIKGRVASLLEVGTGFHPELTGRENIYLNGAIMGMNGTEIKNKFDEIVAFAEVEKFLDTPVKRYSSGMYVRLAFAVAAHLEPEILIVDEVLAVGDVQFQKKCLGKMSDLSRGDGRTVLFVSHNMMAIKNLCKTALYLKNGHMVIKDEVENTISKYLQESVTHNNNDSIESIIKSLPDDDTLEFLDFRLSQRGVSKHEFVINEEIFVEFNYRIKQKTEGLRIGFDFLDTETETAIFRVFHDDNYKKVEHFSEGIYQTTFVLPANYLKDRNYFLSISIGIHNKRWIIYDLIKMKIKVYNIDGSNKIYADSRPGLIMPLIESVTKKINHV